jgi:hypothetical protein
MTPFIKIPNFDWKDPSLKGFCFTGTLDKFLGGISERQLILCTNASSISSLELVLF